jgi:apolipoprotein N-acyltransferase
MPESSFPFPLNKFNEVIDWWFCDLKNKKIHLFLGTHRSAGDKLFNSVYHIYDWKEISIYDKSSLMFFYEYIPKFYSSIPFIKELFLKQSEEFCASKDVNFSCVLDGYSINLCICSELFLKKKFGFNKILFFFFNETTFSTRYIQDLMFLFAKFKATELGKIIVCIAHERFEIY